MATVQHVTAGDFTARTALTGGDELAELGRGFDRLLDERLATLAKAEQENDSLNISVISLLQAVSQLSQRDLTVKVPVNEDITGPMADALNLLTAETAKVLAGGDSGFR
ncbi:MAG: HAMP domain-containing protein [Chromatiales bacterium]|nr:HAMP domain-containing protein [Chromatiales bacterium]